MQPIQTNTPVTSSHLDTTGQQLFELRFERAMSQAAALELASAYRGTGPADEGLWRKFQVPQPVGFWSVSSGRDMPALVSLYAWRGLNHREETLGRLLASQDGRGRMRALARRAESWILIDTPAVGKLIGAAQAPSIDGLWELRVEKVLNGSGREAAQSLCDHEFSTAASLGGRLRGLYELAIGPSRPVLVSLFEWEPGASPHEAWTTLDGADAEQRRFDERSKHRRRLFGECEQSFLSPIAKAWPNARSEG